MAGNGSTGAIAQAAGSMASGIFGMIGGLRASKKQREANLQLTNLAYQKDLEQWNRQNEYNSPSQQMARLSSAGLNPNLVYGNGSQVSAAGPGPKAQVPEAPYFAPKLDVPNVLGTYQDMRLKQAQTDNVEAQTRNLNERTVNEGLRNVLMDLQSQHSRRDLSHKSAMYPFQEIEQYAKSDSAETSAQQLREQLRHSKVINPTKEEIGRLDVVFKQYENQLREIGVTSHDNLLLRGIIQLAHRLNLSISDIIDMLQ